MDIRTQETEPSRPKSLMQRLGLSVLFLGCGLLVFIVSHFTSGELNVQTFWVPSLFLVAAIMTRRSARLNAHWQVFYAFFIFSVVWLFRHSVLDSSLVQPFYSTITGNVVAQLVDSTVVIGPIVLLTFASRANLASIFLRRGNLRLGLPVGLAVLAIFYMLTAVIATTIAGMSPGFFLFLTPYLLILAVANGFKEELWFRGLFLSKYETILGFRLSNFLQAAIFAASVVEAEFSSILLGFALVSFFLGLGFGYLMRRTGSIFGSSLRDAGAPIPIFLIVLSGLTRSSVPKSPASPFPEGPSVNVTRPSSPTGTTL